MYISSALLLVALPTALSQSTFTRSSKRGLVFVPSDDHPSDNQIWVENNSDLTWYYNYSPDPSPAYFNRTQDEFEFVPQLWTTSTTFLADVQTMISGGRNISHVLTYNEPDGTTATGGSQLDPKTAAQGWLSQVQPLKKMGVKLGAPAVTGSPGGFTWLQEFFDACHSLGQNCTADFIPVHWYGNFQGLADHLGQVYGTYPNQTIWITEYALNNATLNDTQSFFNSSADYFDRLTYVERYSYFGSFRSDVSNVGPNAAMLTQNGLLTDIGSWYLGGAATNNIPSATGGAARILEGKTIWGLVVAAVAAGVLVL